MKKRIILASQSVQRKKLLQFLGIKFSVIPADVEEKSVITTTAADLVKENALLKAVAVAEKLNKGVVIGCDTLVYDGDKDIIGKPKNLKQAKQILKQLFSRPHWVLSGVAIVDCETKKTIVDYEKTKIFMSPLTDEEIDSYHKKVAPFDKAGGFDIEGAGSVFIKKVEGCYTNVIGLPMAKLFSMLKKMGVSLLGLIFVVGILSGCATEYNMATGRQETLMYGTEKEISIGNSISKQIEQQYKAVEDIDLHNRVETILNRIVEVCDRKDLVYFIKVLDDEMVNAVSLPGGYVYLFKGLTDKINTDDELAAVIAHEVGHITAKHAMKKLQASYGAVLLQVLAIETTKSSNVAGGVDFALTSVFMSFSQEDEFEADKLSVKYLQKAGYNPQGVIDVLTKLRQEEEKASPKKFSYWRTHPYISQRIANARQIINGQIEFRDYLNLIGRE